MASSLGRMQGLPPWRRARPSLHSPRGRRAGNQSKEGGPRRGHGASDGAVDVERCIRSTAAVTSRAGNSRWLSACSAAALLALLCAWPAYVHVDDTDAGLYRTVVRHLVEDGAWTTLRYLPTAHPQFREHLPFGLWPFAAAQRLGELGPPLVAFATALVTLVLLARRRPLAALVLGLTPAFFTTAALVRLDGWALLGAALVTLGLSEERLGRRAWAFAALGAVVGVAAKGPFGGVPLVAFALARAWEARSGRPLLAGAAVGAVALVLPAAFLLTASADWWQGYVVDQLVASARGSRGDGSSAPWAPLVSVVGRFWPGLALLAWGTLREPGRWRSAGVARLATASGLMLGLLALSGRHVWNHTFVVYPALALLAAEWESTLPAWLGRVGPAVAAVSAVGLLVAGALGLMARLTPCVVPASAKAWLAEHADRPLAVVPPARGGPWRLLATLADEHRAVPVLVEDVGGALRLGLPMLLQGAPPDGLQCTDERPWRLCERTTPAPPAGP